MPPPWARSRDLESMWCRRRMARASCRRCGNGGRRLSGPDWRCRHQQRARPDVDRRKAVGVNTLKLTREVEAGARRAEARTCRHGRRPRDFPARDLHRDVARESERALLVGCVLVIVVLLVFLADWRTALISSMAIPLSLLAAGLLLSAAAARHDGAGRVGHRAWRVDHDAIIDVENIVRRLPLNPGKTDHPYPAIKVVLDASMKCAAPSSTAA